MSDLRKINRDLKRIWGPAPHDAMGRAHFRLAMTTQIEKRIGTVVNFTEGGLYRNTVKGVHTLPKYNFSGHYDTPKWVLERLMFAPLPEVPESNNGSYEPIHVFPHIDGHCVMPNIECLNLFLSLLLYGPKKTYDDYVKEDEKKFKKEVELGETILNDQQSYVQGLIQTGSAATMPTNFKGESPLMKEKSNGPASTETSK